MPALKGVGLLKGLGVTLKTMTRPAATRQYPHVRPDLPARTRGVIALIEENCTVCMLCSRECPDWCIYIDSHKEQVAPKEGGRARTRNMLDRFAIDFALCMYCGICVEVCPFDALHWSPEFEYAEHQVEKLTHEMDTLRTWAYSVPAPDPLEEGAIEPKEIESARKAREAVTAKAAAAAEQSTAAAPAPTRGHPRRRPPPRRPVAGTRRGLGRGGGGRDDHAAARPADVEVEPGSTRPPTTASWPPASPTARPGPRPRPSTCAGPSRGPRRPGRRARPAPAPAAREALPQPHRPGVKHRSVETRRRRAAPETAPRRRRPLDPEAADPPPTLATRTRGPPKATRPRRARRPRWWPRGRRWPRRMPSIWRSRSTRRPTTG